MIRFLLRRLISAVLLVLIVSSSALLLTRLAPGDVTTNLGPSARPDEVTRIRARFNLDRSTSAQWSAWVIRVARFDFGDSYLYNRPVVGLIGRAAVNTATLAFASLLIATLFGIPFGIASGSQSGMVPALIRGASLLCLSVPPLLTSLLLVFIASRTGWFPAGGMTSVDALDAGWSFWLFDVARHLPVPALALALPIAATFERLQSQSIAESFHQPFIAAAVARGVTWRRLVFGHAWRASLRSMCAIYGLAIGTLLSGSFIVEYVTAWPGLGRLMYEALRARDIYLVAGCAAMGGVFLGFGSLLGDLLLFAADPRVR